MYQKNTKTRKFVLKRTNFAAFNISFSQPGTYFVGIYGAWNGEVRPFAIRTHVVSASALSFLSVFQSSSSLY